MQPHIPDTVFAVRRLHMVLPPIALSVRLFYGTVVQQRILMPKMGLELRDAISTPEVAFDVVT